jgi:hypothetical protein
LNTNTKIILLAVLTLSCLIFPMVSSAENINEPVTVTSNGSTYVKFYGEAQGQCFIETGTVPTQLPSEFYLGSGNISLAGNAYAKVNPNDITANQPLNASGSLQLEFNRQTFDLNLQSNNETLAYFENDYIEPGNKHNFIVGGDFSGDTIPEGSRLKFTGNFTDYTGTHIISGTAKIYTGQEQTLQGSQQTITAVIYNEDDTILASAIWSQQEATAPFGFTLNAANVYQRVVDLYSIAPTVKIISTASGQCVYSFIPVQEDPSDEFSLEQGNGNITFYAMALNEGSLRYISEDYCIFNNGIYVMGSINLNMQNQSITGNIYSNGSGTGGMILKEENDSMYLIGNIFESPVMVFNGTLQNATGTYPINGSFEIYSSEILQENSTVTDSLIESILLDESNKPIALAIWSKNNYTEFSEENQVELNAADSFERSVDFCPSACTIIFSSGENIIADHTATTGAEIAINTTTLPTGTGFNITTVNFGSTQPISVPAQAIQEATYFEARILQPNGSVLNALTAQISLTDSNFNSSSTIFYWNSTAWVKAANQQFTAPNTVTAEIPTVDLKDTAIRVNYYSEPPAPTQTPSPSSSQSTTTTPSSTAKPSTSPEEMIPEFSVIAVLGLMMLLTVFVAITRLHRTGKKANFEAAITQN